MKKIFLILLVGIMVYACKEKPESLFDAYFLTGENDNVLLLNLDKFYQKYSKSTDISNMIINGQIIEDGDIILEFNNIVFSGFENYFKIHFNKFKISKNTLLKINFKDYEYTTGILDLMIKTNDTFSNSLINSISNEKGTQNDVIFSINSLRIRENKDEYLPSSERAILRITNENGLEIYNSSLNMVFNQAISPVLPVNVGEVNKVLIPWNYRNNDGKKVAKGKYNVNIIIPSKPTPYSEKTVITID